jgi:hypothetical protein
MPHGKEPYDSAFTAPQGIVQIALTPTCGGTRRVFTPAIAGAEAAGCLFSLHHVSKTAAMRKSAQAAAYLTKSVRP